MSEEKNPITDEEIQKAVSALENDGLLETEEDIEKAQKTKAKAEDEEDYDDEQGEVPGEQDTGPDEYDDDDDDDDDAEKGKVQYKAIKGDKGSYYRKMKKGKNGKMEYADDKKYKKDGGSFKEMSAEEYKKVVGGMKKGETEEEGEEYIPEAELEKAEAIEVSEILKGFRDSIEDVSNDQVETRKLTGVILKGMIEKIDNLQETVDNMAKQSRGRKSAGARPVERFEKGEGEGKNSNVLSVSQDRSRILDIMDGLTFAKGEFDNDMASAMTEFEGSGKLPQNVMTKIEKEGYTLQP